MTPALKLPSQLTSGIMQVSSQPDEFGDGSRARSLLGQSTKFKTVNGGSTHTPVEFEKPAMITGFTFRFAMRLLLTF
jgi:hypothetical protein